MTRRVPSSGAPRLPLAGEARRGWLTTAELAALALPGLPKSRQGWDEYAEREGWNASADKRRLRRGRGGGLE